MFVQKDYHDLQLDFVESFLNRSFFEVGNNYCVRRWRYTMIVIAWPWYPISLFWATFCWKRSSWCINRTSFNLQTFNPTFHLVFLANPFSFFVTCKWVLLSPTTNLRTSDHQSTDYIPTDLRWNSRRYSQQFSRFIILESCSNYLFSAILYNDLFFWFLE